MSKAMSICEGCSCQKPCQTIVADRQAFCWSDMATI